MVLSRLQVALFILTILSVPFAGFQLADFLGYGVTLSDVTAVLMIAVCLLVILIRGRTRVTIIFLGGLGLLFVTSLTVVSILEAGLSPWGWAKFIIHFFFFILFLLAVINTDVDLKTVRSILRLFVIEAVALSVCGIYQLPARLYDWPLGWLPLNNISFGSMRTTTFLEYPRISSVFTEPLWFSSYLIPPILLISFDLFNKSFLFSKRVEFLLLLVLGTSWFLTFSLGAYFVFFFTLLLLFFYLLRKLGAQKLTLSVRNLHLSLTLLTLMVVAGVLLTQIEGFQNLLDAIRHRVGGILKYGVTGLPEALIPGESLPDRLQDFFEAYKIWLAHPIIGIGMDSYYTFYNSENFLDCLYAQFLAEAGILGLLSLAIFFWFILKYISYVARCYRHSPYSFLIRSFYWIIVAKVIGFLTSASFLSMDFWLPVALFLLTAIALRRSYENSATCTTAALSTR